MAARERSSEILGEGIGEAREVIIQVAIVSQTEMDENMLIDKF